MRIKDKPDIEVPGRTSYTRKHTSFPYEKSQASDSPSNDYVELIPSSPDVWPRCPGHNCIDIVVNNPVSGSKSAGLEQLVPLLAYQSRTDFVIEVELRKDIMHEIVGQI
jgi:hypothetical protein